MRALLLAALCVMLLIGAVAGVTTQGDARAIEDRWTNCSDIIHGRLGALHPAGEGPFAIVVKQWLFDKVAAQKWQNRSEMVVVTYTPCVPPYVEIEGAGKNTDITKVTFDGTPTMQPGDKVVQFHMPKAKGEVAWFNANYNGNNRSATVITMCTEGVDALSNITYDRYNNHFTVHIESREACARFPYSNKSMPPGGVAALVVMLIAFVIQFAICGWYHKTYTHDTPFTAAETDYTNVE